MDTTPTTGVAGRTFVSVDLLIQGLKFNRCRVIISIMVMCNDIVIIEYDGRRPGLPNAPIVMERDNHRTNIYHSKQ